MTVGFRDTFQDIVSELNDLLQTLGDFPHDGLPLFGDPQQKVGMTPIPPIRPDVPDPLGCLFRFQGDLFVARQSLIWSDAASLKASP